ncbi:GNAT family N-acetyltransferase [Chitinophaga caeni]|uniref:GNAT family N-acetyltransferase n=1 Tax=Chitinophaga caeni TaxID=2029983 RepID=A0A291QW25_9BACT|nr:GNAT family N-acetyltransferase [Chitinophaga caeni]ATL48135.1 GNAT family N-acetyltransferase [Chitinophaga caeni]
MDLKQIPVTDNELANQFEMRIDNKIAKIEYKITGDRIFLTHTEVPPALEGKGVAAILVEKVLHIVEERGLKLVPLCPYVASYLRRHPDWKRLLAHGINL